jgi:hypothetical protein
MAALNFLWRSWSGGRPRPVGKANVFLTAIVRIDIVRYVLFARP